MRCQHKHPPHISLGSMLLNRRIPYSVWARSSYTNLIDTQHHCAMRLISDNPNWPVYADVFEHPPPRLASRRPMWSDMTPVDTIAQWRENWSSASVVNHTIVTDPTIRQPGFDLPRHTCSLMNRFRTGQGPCHANLHKWGVAQSPCNCGQRQTMNNIVDTCPLTNLTVD